MKIKCIHHVTFAVADLDKQEAFAVDFGLVTAEKRDDRLVMRTRGGDNFAYVAHKADADAMIGIAFEAEDAASLDEAVETLGAQDIGELDLPGGGRAVKLTDPEGLDVLIIHGNERISAGEAYPEIELNTPFRKQRFGKNQHSRAIGPARLWRLGHVGLFVKDFPKTSAWYEKNIGMIGSDIYHIPGQPQAKIVGFLRLNRGEEYVDHHSIALMQDERGGCHHISYEAQDFEAQNRTHNFLKQKKYEPIWGVGRHPHGSHIFDVWRSPDGARFESFSDTDLFRESDGTNFHDISQVMMDEWRDEGPEAYFA